LKKYGYQQVGRHSGNNDSGGCKAAGEHSCFVTQKRHSDIVTSYGVTGNIKERIVKREEGKSKRED
jgi:hypothetical protein